MSLNSLNSVFDRPIEEFEKNLSEMEPILEKATYSLSAFGTPVIRVDGYTGSYSLRRLEDQVNRAASDARRSLGAMSEISAEQLQQRLAGCNISKKLYSFLDSRMDDDKGDRYENPTKKLYDKKMAEIPSSIFMRLLYPIRALWYSIWTRISWAVEQEKYPHRQRDYIARQPMEEQFRMILPSNNLKIRVAISLIFKRVNQISADHPEVLYEPTEIEQAIKKLKESKAEITEIPTEVHPVEGEFFKAITPQTIDEKLNVLFNSFRYDIKQNFLNIFKNTDTAKHIYSVALQYKRDKLSPKFPDISKFLYIRDGKFSLATGNDTYVSFENLDEFLRYLFKGEFKDGEIFRTDCFIMMAKDGSLIQYQNPFKAV